MAFADTKDGPADKGHKKLPSTRRACHCHQGPGNSRAAVGILGGAHQEPGAGPGARRKKAALFALQPRASGADRVFPPGLQRHTSPAHPAHLGLLSPKKNTEAFFRCMEDSF